MKFVFFIDALDPEDVKSACPEMYDDMVGQYDVGVPRVTPNIVSQVMTGLPPEEMQMIRSTPLFEPSEEEGQRWVYEDGEPVEAEQGPVRGMNGDPVQGQQRVGIHPYNNILENLDEEGVRIFQHGTPFCAFVDLENGLSAYDEMNNEAAPEFMNFATPPTQFMDDDWDLIHDSYVSDTVLELETMKQIARQGNVDVTFLGYKHIDHCTHWYFPDCKESLIQVLWAYIKDLREMGHEVMWWSDHGSQDKKAVFNINRWLQENGYLDYTFDKEFADKLKDKGVIPDNGFDQQVQFNHPALEVDWENSVAFTSDAFDSMVDVTENATDEEIDELVEDLENHPGVRNVWRKAEVMDEGAEHYWYAPELIVEREDHTLVTGNMHPNIPCYLSGDDHPSDWKEYPYNNMGMRPGVHSRRGCYGGDISDDAEVEDGKPFQLYDIIWNFVDPESINSEGDAEISKREEQQVEDRMDQFGYL